MEEKLIEMDKVTVWQYSYSKTCCREIFSHEEDGLAHRFAEGRSEWTSYGVTQAWPFCRRPTPEELGS